ncbi:MAG: TonB-dependent receptor plug domain-containing protein [Woeseiaceae bacterium]
MNRKTIPLAALATVFAGGAFSPDAALAQGASDELIEEIVTLGSRSAKPRSAADSTVPVDVIGGEDFNSLGNTADLTDNLKALVPSYTATPATGDGSAFVRPTSLRGTAPDQSLVLVNGKRRHRSALVQFFAPAAGNGAHGVDIGMIPGIAVKSVEVLRDGAASQYGSDAIAGVINFNLKDAAEGGQVQVQYGEHANRGEQSTKFGANAGFAAGDSGFINVSIEVIDNDALSRGIQRIDSYNTVLASGVNPAIIGADAPFGDAPLLQTWGRPETSGTRFFMNSGFEINDSAELYARLGVADTDGRYRFFYRDPVGNAVFSQQLAFGGGCPTCDPNDPMDTANLREQGFVGLPAGFTPYLDGEQSDSSLVIGVTGEFESGMTYDLSYGFGKNELDYFLNNTANQSLGPGDGQTLPQMDFDVGGYTQEEVNLNADFSLPLSDAVNFAFGAEAREETYTAFQGEPSSYFGAGSSGFKGITPQDSGEFDRDNIAFYADIEHDVNDAALVQYALRYENFSDFGDTINGKVAFRYRFSDALAMRGAVSTGFHAPTPGQANVRTTITTFDGVTGLQVEEGLVPSTDPRVAAVGGTALKEEKSLNYSLGVAADLTDSWSATLDLYRIEVDDRIYRTGDIAVPNTTNTISFYTNALDVEHSGVDLVVTGGWDWADAANTSLTFAYGYNKVEIAGQSQINGVNPVSDSLIEDIENNYPNHRWVATANTYFGENFNTLLRLNYYGEHYDERGTIGAAVDPSAEIDSTIYVDLEFGYQLTENVKLIAGGVNILDEFIDEIGPPNSNRLSVGLQYPRRSAANYEGAAWYLKGILSW